MMEAIFKFDIGCTCYIGGNLMPQELAKFAEKLPEIVIVIIAVVVVKVCIDCIFDNKHVSFHRGVVPCPKHRSCSTGPLTMYG